MGDILSIRVMAQTLNEDDVLAAWPELCSLVWPEWTAGRKLRSKGVERLMGPVLGPGPVEKFLGGRKHGVVELASDLVDLLKFGELPAAIKESLIVPVGPVDSARLALAKALGDWAVQDANAATNALEKALDAAEKALEKAV
ncbi:hypothetical protein LJC48_02500 [Desulfovibrio sp. OttesenSCG-928-C06]|nr:hypothetical protein [Desulfovibrio sp. OttesenSCG-928-C06]